MWLNVCWAPVFSTTKIFSDYIISVFEPVRV
jgi:hypothetical protein